LDISKLMVRIREAVTAGTGAVRLLCFVDLPPNEIKHVSFVVGLMNDQPAQPAFTLEARTSTMQASAPASHAPLAPVMRLFRITTVSFLIGSVPTTVVEAQPPVLVSFMQVGSSSPGAMTDAVRNVHM
jgi:hypothetical protein